MTTSDDPRDTIPGPTEPSSAQPIPSQCDPSDRTIGAPEPEPLVLKRDHAHRGEGGSWVERLRACKSGQALQIAPDVARRLRRAGVPDAVVAQLPADFQGDPWAAKLVTLPGVFYDGHEYVSTRIVFVVLGERADGNKSSRLARLMRALGWERCKLYPHLGFGRKVVRGFKRPLVSVAPPRG